MTFSAIGIAAYVLAAIVVVFLALRMLWRDSKDRTEMSEELAQQAKLAEVAAKAHRNNIKQSADGHTTYGDLPVIEVEEVEAEWVEPKWDEITSRLDNVIIR